MSQPEKFAPTPCEMFVLKIVLQSGPCTRQDIYDQVVRGLNASQAEIDNAIAGFIDGGMFTADERIAPTTFQTAFDDATKAAMLLVLHNVNVAPPSQVDPSSDCKVKEFPFPVSNEVAAKVAEQSRFLADLVVRSADEILSRLQVRYRFPSYPHLARLAAAILKQPPSCLSFDGEQYWLTFENSDHPIHLMGVSAIPLPLYDKFQIQSVPSLEEFLQYFGGISNGWRLPPCNYFLLPAETVCVSKDDIQRDWGTIGDWAGSLLLYQGASGDEIVIHPNGTPGAWFHEVAWESLDEVAFQPIDATFPELIDHFAECLALPLESKKWKESPFYY